MGINRRSLCLFQQPEVKQSMVVRTERYDVVYAHPAAFASRHDVRELNKSVKPTDQARPPEELQEVPPAARPVCRKSCLLRVLYPESLRADLIAESMSVTILKEPSGLSFQDCPAVVARHLAPPSPRDVLAPEGAVLVAWAGLRRQSMERDSTIAAVNRKPRLNRIRPTLGGAVPSVRGKLPLKGLSARDTRKDSHQFLFHRDRGQERCGRSNASTVPLIAYAVGATMGYAV